MEKVIIVTGGARGIRAATCRLGATGVQGLRQLHPQPEATDHVIAECDCTGANAAAVQADISAEADVVRLVETVKRKRGGYVLHATAKKVLRTILGPAPTPWSTGGGGSCAR